MTTKELAQEICQKDFGTTDEVTVAAVYLRLLSFVIHLKDGYSPEDEFNQMERSYANRNGYFWLPCALCGNWYSGHHGSNFIPLTKSRGVSVCYEIECAEEAKRLRELYPEGIEGEL